jgi:hypothetical protein
MGAMVRWLIRAMGLGFVLGAAVGVRAARHGRDGGDARAMAERVERALRILGGREDAAAPQAETAQANATEGPA